MQMAQGGKKEWNAVFRKADRRILTTLLFVVQILQVSGSHFVGVGRSEKP